MSADVGVRKPDTAIYDYLRRIMGVIPQDILFVDDRPKNLDSAAVLGFDTILFDPTHEIKKASKHRKVTTFKDIVSILTTDK
ncbi:HAD-IA family hydrolase [Chloroflexota bacterium]